MAQVMPTELSEPPFVEEALDADDRVQLQERKCRRRAVEVDLAPPELRRAVGRQRVDVDLQAGDGERRLRADTGADAAEIGAFDRLVQLELAAPVVLVAEGVEAEDLLALLEQAFCAFASRLPGSSAPFPAEKAATVPFAITPPSRRSAPTTAETTTSLAMRLDLDMARLPRRIPSAQSECQQRMASIRPKAART